MKVVFSLFNLFLIFNAATAQEKLFQRHGIFMNFEGESDYNRMHKSGFNFGYSYQVNDYSRFLGGVKIIGLGRDFGYTDSISIKNLKGAPNDLTTEGRGLGFFVGYQVHSDIFNSRKWQFKVSGISNFESSNYDTYSNLNPFLSFGVPGRNRISEGSYNAVSLEVPMAIEYNTGSFFLEIGSRILATRFGMDTNTSLDQSIPLQFREITGFIIDLKFMNSGYVGFGYRFGKKVGTKITSDPSN
jgi:hypothetical protein